MYSTRGDFSPQVMNRLRNKPIEIAAKQNMREDVRVNPPSLGLDELVIEFCVKLPPEMRTLLRLRTYRLMAVLRKNVD